MKTIEDIMGLIEDYAELSCKLGFRHLTPYEYSCKAEEKSKEIESALRELVERKPLDQKAALNMWMETGCIDHESGGIELIRKVERAHGIGE